MGDPKRCLLFLLGSADRFPRWIVHSGARHRPDAKMMQKMGETLAKYGAQIKKKKMVALPVSRVVWHCALEIGPTTVAEHRENAKGTTIARRTGISLPLGMRCAHRHGRRDRLIV